ncbi:MAG: alpha-N-arabinofuranosidase [Candidatus Cellulosilyticum pullistercoris]|uniref:non-reducing end alpha-L-arabinofuranosidase n=1 Tax=Candidatus Cellulosilyticum pullistercoris TaxID=2838521 RepID=A0A9E2KCR5_9FIRM|nr:alpha-N-arabinofuranosidase [Candidatus Cellulosilyticum pullistercoris]
MYKMYINPNIKKGHINKEIYGHFSEHLGRCIYEGIFVGEDSHIPNTRGMRNDVVAALKAIKVPVLRWPGGCFADEYHWKDGIGPKENRKKMINTHWGGVVEDNSFGTHEFMELCEQLGCEAYINGNVGSGSVQEMNEWIEYMTFDGVSPMATLRAQNGHPEPWKVSYFGVGNENWGCGGNMTPEHYANMYRRYQTYVRDYNSDSKVFKICCGANSNDYAWTKGVLETCFKNAPEHLHGFMDGLSLHYYTLPKDNWQDKGNATGFDEEEWYTTLEKTLRMEELVKRHSTIMDEYDPEKKIGLIVDEWGTWFNVESGTNPGFLYQQNTMRDALVAGINLNIFNKNCDRVKMANIAQMVNVLQSVILTEGEKMILTPTYYVFYLYKNHQDATLIHSHLQTTTIGSKAHQVPNLHESVSMNEEGIINITINNLSVTESYEIESILTDWNIKDVKGTILTNKMDAYNSFEQPEAVGLADFTDFTLTEQGIKFTLPPCSVLHLEAK